MLRRYLPLFAVTVFFAVLLGSCVSTPKQIDTQWTEDMFFKNAQVAMDENSYKTALFYYEVFLVRYPENLPRVVAAEYERAFIYYKMGYFKEAQEGYNTIIKRYEESVYAMLYPPRFLELCHIGLVNIEKQRAVKNKLFWRVQEKKWAEENGETITDEGTTPQI